MARLADRALGAGRVAGGAATVEADLQPLKERWLSRPLRSAPFDLLLSDLNLGDGSARDLLVALDATARPPGFSVVLMSAEVDDLEADDPLHRAVAAVLAKTGDARQMVALALQAARRG